MAAATTWRSLLRVRVLAVDAACSQVPGQLDTALGRLMDPLHRGRLRDPREVARVSAVLDSLRQASSNLAYAMPRMGAVRELALRGGGLLPSYPLHSVGELPDQYQAERNAVAKLDKARDRAGDAYEALERCRGHLFVAEFLLSHQACERLPGVDGLIEEQRVAAIDALEHARAMVLACAYHARGARDDIN